MILEEKYAKQKIDRLDVAEKIIEILKNNNIDTLGKLGNKKLTDLIEIGLSKGDIDKLGNEFKFYLI